MLLIYRLLNLRHFKYNPISKFTKSLIDHNSGFWGFGVLGVLGFWV